MKKKKSFQVSSQLTQEIYHLFTKDIVLKKRIEDFFYIED